MNANQILSLAVLIVGLIGVVSILVSSGHDKR